MDDTNCPEGADCGIHNRRDRDVYYDPETREVLLYSISYVGNHVVFTCEAAPYATLKPSWTLREAFLVLTRTAFGPQYETNIILVGDLCLGDATDGTFEGVRALSRWRQEHYGADNIAERHHMTADALRADMLELN